MGIYNDWLERQALVSVTQPLSRNVDSNDSHYRSEQGDEKLGWRHFRRRLQFAWSGQQKYLRDRMDPNWKRGLWVYKGIPQLGDALMDLAPRSLLHEQGICIDLYTDTHLALMFSGDPWLAQVYDDPGEIGKQNYDFVIVPSHKHRSLRHKSRWLPDVQWVSMHGFYTGPEFHRGKFATQRFMDLLDHDLTEQEFARHQQQKLGPLLAAEQDPARVIRIAFALGGVDASRTYDHWLAVAEALLHSDKSIKFTLLGSSNASEVAQALMNSLAATGKVINQVNKTDIAQCRRLIHAHDLLVAADGGLMHLGATTGVKLVSLFHAGVTPRWRLSGRHLQSALQSQTLKVNDIAAPAIVDTCLEILHPIRSLPAAGIHG